MMSMLVVLPKKQGGLADIEKQATTANITKWTGSLRSQSV
jgi:hypothetical protein